MTIESLIEELEQIIDEGKSVPFTSNQIVDVERLRTTIEDMRLNMPDELMQARKIASERKEILVEQNLESTAHKLCFFKVDKNNFGRVVRQDEYKRNRL